ncbi:hypothetical protein [Actinokineospora sp. HUAS TT18]|uniref:hypothetical protein n=1 Tax=Actinokineospora sp. HUAS TT18 TaxID=3447451 RepID=UPI003F522C71
MTPLRLPDQFSPDALAATAATPTCCCCCCCCLATTLTAPIVLHGDLRNELKEVQADTKVAPVVAALIWPALLAAVFYVLGETDSDRWLLLTVGCVAAAAAVSAAVAGGAGSTRPFAAAGRVLMFALMFTVEFFLGAFLVMLYGLYLLVGPIVAAMAIKGALKAYR